jgi:hypothetical protein
MVSENVSGSGAVPVFCSFGVPAPHQRQLDTFGQELDPVQEHTLHKEPTDEQLVMYLVDIQG